MHRDRACLSDGSPAPSMADAELSSALRREVLSLKREVSSLRRELEAAHEETRKAGERARRDEAQHQRALLEEQRRAFRAVERLQAELSAERLEKRRLEHELAEEKRAREASVAANDEADVRAKDLQRELLSAQCQIEIFAQGSPPHLLRAVQRAQTWAHHISAGDSEAERMWGDGLAAQSGVAMRVMGRDPASAAQLFGASESPAIRAVAGLVTPQIAVRDGSGDAGQGLQRSMSMCGGGGDTTRSSASAWDRAASPSFARPLTSALQAQGLSAHRGLWFADRGIQ